MAAETLQLTLLLDTPAKSESIKIASNTTVAALVNETARQLGVKELKSYDFRCVSFASDVKLLSAVDQVRPFLEFSVPHCFVTANTGQRWRSQQIDNLCERTAERQA